MASPSKIIAFCIFFTISSFGVLVEAGDKSDVSGIIEPLLATGLMALLLKKKGHGYSGRAHQHPPPAVQSYEHVPAGPHAQGHIPPHAAQEYAPNRQRHQYERENNRYSEEKYEEPRYLHQDEPQYIMAHEQPAPEARYVFAQQVPQSRYVVAQPHVQQTGYIQQPAYAPKPYGR